MNKKYITCLTMLLYGLPYGWLAIWWDGVGSTSAKSALLFYAVHGIVYAVLAIVVTMLDNIKLMWMGYLLSMATSKLMTILVVVKDMDHFYKPFTYETVIYFPYLPAFLISGLGFFVAMLFVLPSKNK